MSNTKQMMVACECCGHERLVNLLRGKPVHSICKKCALAILHQGRIAHKSTHWKGGIVMSSWGYILMKAPWHPCAHANGYIKRARLILEQNLKRYLLDGMDVHHLNGKKTDDTLENLVEISHAKHTGLHRLGVRKALI